MTSRDFCYWLQGLFELTSAGDLPNTGPMALTPKQSQGTPDHQAELQKLHDQLKANTPKIGGVTDGGIAYRC